MTSNARPRLMLIIFATGFGCLGINLHAEEGHTARTFLYQQRNLQRTREAWQSGQPWTQAPMANLFWLADTWYERGPFSVTNTTLSQHVPGASPNDLATTGFYWWPNPDTPDGIPFVHRDGFGNPDSNGALEELQGASKGIQANALAYYFTGDEMYAQRAAHLARVFFIDEQTRMTPHTEFGKVIPGVSDGGFIVAGIGNRFREIYDGLGILEQSPHWSSEDRQAMQRWSTEFLDWMETSEKGRHEFNQNNNHGTNFDMVAALLSLYVEDEDKALHYVRNYAENRIPEQFDADGRQPTEFDRADNLFYAEYHLRVAYDIAALGEQIGYDVWNTTTGDGGGLRTSTDFLVPYFLGIRQWDLWPTGNKFSAKSWTWHDLLQRSADGFNDPEYIEFADKAGGGNGVSRITNLTHPFLAVTYYGDSNLDGLFDSADLIQVMQTGEYEDGVLNNSTWADGDWNGDREFDSSDIVVSMQAVGYNQGPRDAAYAVPEPSSFSLITLAGLLLVAAARRGQVQARDCHRRALSCRCSA